MCFFMQTYARKEAIEAGHAAYANKLAGKLLNYYGELFGIDYPFEKLGRAHA